MKKKKKKYANKATGMSALADGNIGNFSMQNAVYDPNGMWTGTPADVAFGYLDPTPEQDVDDL